MDLSQPRSMDACSAGVAQDAKSSAAITKVRSVATTFEELCTDHAAARELSIAESVRRGLARSTPSLDLTYGDIGFEAIREGLAAASPPKGGTFVDLGSGSGRAAVAAALLFDLGRCIGIEILTDLHQAATETAQRYKAMRDCLADHPVRTTSSIEFVCGDIFLEGPRVLREADVTFVCCVTWDSAIMHRLAHLLAVEMRPGTKILTVGQPLPAHVELQTSGKGAVSALPHEGAPGVGEVLTVVRFDETWHGLATCEWGREVMVLHEV